MRRGEKRNTGSVPAKLVWLLWLAGLGTSLQVQGQVVPLDSVYQLRTGREVGLLGAGLAANGAAYLVNRGVITLTPVEIDEINPGRINAFRSGRYPKLVALGRTYQRYYIT